jgi:starvation-inducible DNA-binding protein
MPHTDTPTKTNAAPPVVAALERLLADTYTLALKTQNFHWNVMGPRFNDLHTMFEGQYTLLAAAVDELAERLRALGAPAPGSYKAFSALTRIVEAKGGETAEEMVRGLAEGHEEASTASKALIRASEQADDPVTADMATGRATEHDKTAWMLRAMGGH